MQELWDRATTENLTQIADFASYRSELTHEPKSRRKSPVGIVTKLFDSLGARYATRPGGYTRIVKIGQRSGDAAEVVQLELV